MKNSFLAIAMLLSCYLITAQNEVEPTITSTQKKPLFNIKDSPIQVGVFYKITLSDKLTLQNGLSVRKNIDFDTFEIPVSLKYDVNNTWSTFLGVQARTIIKSNYLVPYENLIKPSNSYLTIGSEYRFNNDAIGNFTIGFPFDVHFSLQF